MPPSIMSWATSSPRYSFREDVALTYWFMLACLSVLGDPFWCLSRLLSLISLLIKDVLDVYATSEPQEAFHQRASFCLKLYNDSIKVSPAIFINWGVLSWIYIECIRCVCKTEPTQSHMRCYHIGYAIPPQYLSEIPRDTWAASAAGASRGRDCSNGRRGWFWNGWILSGLDSEKLTQTDK